MSVLWIDATAGVAGDMLLAALLDAGADLAQVQRAVDAVIPESVRLHTHTVDRQGQRALKLEIDVLVDDPPHRTWNSIKNLLEQADLADRTRQLALATMGRLAQAEGRVHGIDPEEVHFHEVGALDSIADVVGVCEAIRLLGVTDVVGSTVAVGAGRVRVAHGLMPVPVPAVAELALGWPTMSGVIPAAARGHAPGHHHHDHHHQVHEPSPEPGELATPTGMALVRSLCGRSGAQPAMTTTAIGIGAGTKDTPARPNVVRVFLGSVDPATPGDVMVELQANVDDLDPRLWPGVIEALMAAGAADAWLVPIVMKKGRPAHTLHALVSARHRDQVTSAIFAATSTFGVRAHESVQRSTLDRSWTSVAIDDDKVRVKLAWREGVVVRATAEFDEVAALARRTGRSEVDVLADVTAAMGRAGLRPGSVPEQTFDSSSDA